MRGQAGRRSRLERGFTLIELMIVILLLGLVMAVAVRGMRSLAKSDMRTSAVKMAGAIRYLFDRASTTGKMHRLVIDFENKKYWAEVSDDAYYMPRERETDETRQADAEEQAREDEESKKKAEEAQAAGETQSYDMTRYQPQEWKAKRARFSAYVFLSCEVLRAFRIHSPALGLLAVGFLVNLQLPASRRFHPSVDPRRVLARLRVRRKGRIGAG